MDINERTQAVFQKVFNDPSLTIRRDLTAADVTGWDSLSHIRLMISLEREFHVKFKSSEVILFKNVGDLIDAITLKMNEVR